MESAFCTRKGVVRRPGPERGLSEERLTGETHELGAQSPEQRSLFARAVLLAGYKGLLLGA